MIGKYYLLILVVLVFVILEISVMPQLTIQGASPSLLVITLASLTILGLAEEGFIVAMLGGVLLDLLTAPPFGRETLTLALVWVVFFLALRYRLTVPRVAFVSGAMAAAGLLAGIPTFVFSLDWLSLAASTFLHVLVGIVLFPLFSRLLTRQEPVKL